MKRRLCSVFFLILISVACFSAQSSVQGIYGVHTGYVGEAIELKDGQFRYWYSTDMLYPGMPQYPFTGTYSIEKDILTLHHPDLEKKAWRCKIINGNRFLMPVEKSRFELNLLQFHRKDSDSPWDGTPDYEMTQKLIHGNGKWK